MTKSKGVFTKDHVPAGPFVGWLQKKIRPGETDTQVSKRVGLSFGQVKEIRQGTLKTIPLSTVDRVLCREGSTHLDELYPYDE